MFEYRLTAPLLPGLLIFLLPAFAAYPWKMPIGNSLTLPFLTLLIILFCSLRYPGILFSPIVFLAGLSCDLFTRSPPGYWTFLFLMALTCARGTTQIVEARGRAIGWICFLLTLVVITFLGWVIASLYQGHWQTPHAMMTGMGLALILLPFPALLLTGLEDRLVLHADKKEKRYRW